MGVGSGRREIRGGGRARPAPWRESPPALHPAEAHAPLPDGEIVGACWRSAWCIPYASGRRVAPTGRSASSAACLEGSVASIYPPLTKRSRRVRCHKNSRRSKERRCQGLRRESRSVHAVPGTGRTFPGNETGSSRLFVTRNTAGRMARIPDRYA